MTSSNNWRINKEGHQENNDNSYNFIVVPYKLYTNFTIGERFWKFIELYNGSDGTEQLCICNL